MKSSVSFRNCREKSKQKITNIAMGKTNAAVSNTVEITKKLPESRKGSYEEIVTFNGICSGPYIVNVVFIRLNAMVKMQIHNATRKRRRSQLTPKIFQGFCCLYSTGNIRAKTEYNQAVDPCYKCNTILCYLVRIQQRTLRNTVV